VRTADDDAALQALGLEVLVDDADTAGVQRRRRDVLAGEIALNSPLARVAQR
jgi:hypothetical protein